MTPALQELAELVAIADPVERTRACVAWSGRWVEIAVLDSDSDEAILRCVPGDGARFRWEQDRFAAEALAQDAIRQKPDELVRLEDLGRQKVEDPGGSYTVLRSRLSVAFLRAEPNERVRR